MTAPTRRTGRCNRCGGELVLGPGKGPHAASLRCAGCDRFHSWVSKRVASDLTEGELIDALQRDALRRRRAP